MALPQITHFRKKVVYQLVICNLYYLKCLSDKIIHIITEIIFNSFLKFLRRRHRQERIFMSKEDISTSLWWSPFISVELLWHSSHLLMTSVTDLLVCFCNYAVITYQKEWNLFVPHCWIKFAQKTPNSATQIQIKLSTIPSSMLLYSSLGCFGIPRKLQESKES